MSITTQSPEQLQEKTFFDLAIDIRSDYAASLRDAKIKAIKQLKDDIETAVAVLPSNWPLHIYHQVFNFLNFVSEETGNEYEIKLINYLDITTHGKVGDISIVLLTNNTVLSISRQGVLMPYIGLMSPGTIVTMDIETKMSTRHDNYFAFVKYCLDVMCKNYK